LLALEVFFIFCH
jgi:hypothetical protein